MYHALLRAVCAGQIPKELATLSKLRHLYLDRNQLVGEENVERDDVVATFAISPGLLKNSTCSRLVDSYRSIEYVAYIAGSYHRGRVL